MPFRPLVLGLAAACALSAALSSAPARAAEQGVVMRKLGPLTETMPEATGVRLGGDNLKTRFVVDLSRKIDIATFMLADPYRVVVDLPQIMFKLPAHSGDHGRGLIKAFRYGLIMQRRLAHRARRERPGAGQQGLRACRR